MAMAIAMPKVGAATAPPADPLPAFPGAEGFGAVATGGRGGAVVHVTNLNDDGPGSLRDAVSQPKRIVVFDVSGIIRPTKQIAGASDVTILGQTARGEGITISGPGISFSGQSNVVVRHLRLRGAITNSRGSKQLNVSGGSKMIFDHLSISWGRWDNLGFTERCSDLTLQDCIVAEAIDPQRFGAIIDSSDRLTVVRTLWANNQNRNPKGKANMQYINNVVYNWGSGGYAGGHSGAPWKQDLINNVFIAGPNSSGEALGGFGTNDLVFASGNLVDLDRDGRFGGAEPKPQDYRPMTATSGDATFVEVPQNAPAILVATVPARDAFEKVLADAGASRFRDAHDRRIVEHARSLGTLGAVIREESAVGGVGTLNEARAPADTDGDGIPDAWEAANGLDPNDVKDGPAIDAGTGYANVERYANDLVK